MHLLLVNFPLLASLEKRSTCRELNCFLRAGNRNNLKKEILVNEVAGNGFALFWEAVIELEVKAFPYFQE